MLKKILRVTGIVLGSIVVLAIGYYVKVCISVNNRHTKTYTVTPQVVNIPTDSASYALGGRLIKAKGCTDCHGDDMGGKNFIDDPALGLIVARNLTKGKGGLPQDYSTADWVLALKHGLDRDHKPLIIMPAHEYTMLSEQDMGSIIAYCQTLPNVDRELEESSIGPLGNILTDAGKIALFPAEAIDHNRTLTKEVVPAVTVAYGEYVAVACQGCHRKNMKGGEPVAPGFPVVADISSTGHPANWTDEQFIATLRTGKTPEGKVLNPKEMPWTMTKELTDVELKALHLYLKSI
ncbi:cytochrome c4 [Pseudochryseolinea flava]|uniref:Cytochrome c n=1 Tax=Pseudochryseolinea flava TaxID=2059302 RepID=A0A364Y1H5_9BACT|nr:cytochrome c [Pseudochryseolinea flava]RAW00691.1 cytochrome c [Pseudochryseolinea flava]